MAAVVADERPGGTVPGERHAAQRAVEGRAAAGALQVDREAAAVQEDERLPAGGEVRLERAAELLGDQARALAVVGPGAQVDDLHRGQRLRGRPLGQREQTVPAVERGLVALGRRGGGGEHGHRTGEAGAHDGQVARIVAQPLLLLVGRVVLLVDHHEPQPPGRREDRRARADDDPRVAGEDAPPLAPAFARPEPAVKDRHLAPETAAHPLDQLVGERDLRHEQDDLAAGGEGRRGGGEEDLGLAAAGDAVQEEGGVPPACHRLRDRVGGRALRRREGGAGRVLGRRRRGACAHDGLGEPGGHQRPERRGADAGRARGRGGELRVRGRGEYVVGARAGGRAAGERRLLLGGEAAGEPERTLLARSWDGSRHDGRDHLGERDEIVSRGPAAELEQIGRQERVRIEHVDDAAQLAGRQGVGEGRNHPGARLAAERHAHAHARPDALPQRLGNAVGEEVVPGDGRQRGDGDQAMHAVRVCHDFVSSDRK